VNDPKVAALRGKVEVMRDESFTTVAAAVEIVTADGKLHKLSQTAARGSDLNPMTDRDLEDKLRNAAGSWDPRHDVAPLIAAIWDLDKAEDASKLVALAVPRA
jgi:2-methylcitrate dehydratase PrpD